jgi:AcrR family transcriptional regulator
MQNITERQFEIIEAAGKILTREGVSGLTTKNLAKEMQFSESAIYRHFAGKEDIILALLNFLAENMETRLSEIVLKHKNPLEAFCAVFESQFHYFSKNPFFVVAVFSDGLLEESEKINASILKIMQIKMKILMPIIMQAQAEKIFTQKITAEEMLHIVMGTFRLQMFKWRLADFQFDIKRLGKNMTDTVLTLVMN